jgi:osmotically-inducible protein OsmY
LLWGCASPTQIGKAANDQDVARDVSWELRKDARLSDVTVGCAGGTVTLKGRVDSRAAEADAVRIAQSSAHGGRVISELEIRPR